MIIEYSTPPHSAFLETCHHWDVHVQYCIFWHISVVFILDFMVLYSIFEYSTSPDWAFLVTCFPSDFRYRKVQRTFFEFIEFLRYIKIMANIKFSKF